MDVRVDRRTVLLSLAGCAMGTCGTAPCWGVESKRALIAEAAGFVLPHEKWKREHFYDFLNSLPGESRRSLKISLELQGPTSKAIGVKEDDVEAIRERLLWISNHWAAYPFSSEKRLDYHAVVKWASGKLNIDEDLINERSTFELERFMLERFFVGTWDSLSHAQREELIDQIDPDHKISDRAGLAAASGSVALAMLATTVHVSGFAFYTTMSVMISTVAGWVGVTLPFAAYTSASSIVAFLSGPVGWAVAAIAAAVSIWILGGPSMNRTTAAILQIHLTKVAALKAAHFPEGEVFQR